MKDLRGRVAAVTGAASGIGRALAEALAREGCALALSDVDEAGLETTAARTSAQVKTTARRVDVADRDAVFEWAEAAASDHGRVNLIVNNAGVALGARVATMSEEDLRWLLDINFWGVVHGTRAFLPHLEAAGEGHVVNISSMFGLIAFPTQSAYCAAKFAVRAYTEALRMELEIQGSPVSATCVHPGGVKTNIARSTRLGAGEEDLPSVEELADRFEAMARTTPERAAEIILRGVKRNRRRIMVGADAAVTDWLQRITGSGYQRLLVAVGRRRRERS